jgi:hypothetical protein
MDYIFFFNDQEVIILTMSLCEIDKSSYYFMYRSLYMPTQTTNGQTTKIDLIQMLLQKHRKLMKGKGICTTEIKIADDVAHGPT